jgi:hypothetical protein
MVISKPKRMSTNDGVVHCIFISSLLLVKYFFKTVIKTKPGHNTLVFVTSLNAITVPYGMFF